MQYKEVEGGICAPKGFARRLGGLMGNPNAFKGLK